MLCGRSQQGGGCNGWRIGGEPNHRTSRGSLQKTHRRRQACPQGSRRLANVTNSEWPKTVLDTQKLPSDLKARYDSFWPAFTQQIRASRNDAGHPSVVDPVTPETVHASLLIFPELLKLAADLRVWVVQNL